MDYGTIKCWHEKLYSGKKVKGAFVFPFPLYEIDFEQANNYIIQTMTLDAGMKGFLWTDPIDIRRNMKFLREAGKKSVRFSGVKPYFDFLRKDNFETEMEEILPPGLLELINSEKLLIMLHTTGKGIGEKKVRDYISRITEKYENIKIILAHMGRFLRPQDFEEFMKSDLPGNPAVFLDTSSATMPEVYQMALSEKKLWNKILFGSDIPFGLITGTEFWSDTAGAIFRTRDKYTWSEEGSYGCDNMTYNTYHVIKALKDAIDALKLTEEKKIEMKTEIMLNNALKLCQ